MEENIFKAHYEDYCRQVAECDFSAVKERLGIETREKEAIIPLLGETYSVSANGVTDSSGNRPGYGICVILFKYLLLCPDAVIEQREWAAIKDLKKMSQFTNINVFKSDVEDAIVKQFSGQLDTLSDASKKLGGKPSDMGKSYDFAAEFRALPRIDILLLFNDRDEEFPAACSLLFQRQAEHYLDPESLIMTGMAFTKRLKEH